ncbi:hypothetical protein HID58_043030 [Brassica napus]|uniref:Uncharacterized protein n=1 Tax=Brassica napus TaxID=3708 RepID=A0ABQ8BFB0_BRANA|nr:hypothetical protein HID58_043030 [Brassica napus]
MAGRLTLLYSVISGLVGFNPSSFLLFKRQSTGNKNFLDGYCFPKKKGGLGMRNFRVGMKLAWIELSTCLTLLWALNEKSYRFYWIFKKLFELKPEALKLLICQIGNGNSAFFWWDPWTPFGTFYSYIGAEGQKNGWILQWARSDIQLQLLAYMSTLVFSSNPNTYQWKI